MLDACGSAFDSWLRVYRDADNDGVPDTDFGAEVFSCDDCGAEICGVATRTRIATGFVLLWRLINRSWPFSVSDSNGPQLETVSHGALVSSALNLPGTWLCFATRAT